MGDDIILRSFRVATKAHVLVYNEKGNYIAYMGIQPEWTIKISSPHLTLCLAAVTQGVTKHEFTNLMDYFQAFNRFK